MLKRISFSSEGYLGFSLPRRSAHFAKDGAFFCLGTGVLEKTNKCVKTFLKDFFLGRN
jgi:hypothetical protein